MWDNSLGKPVTQFFGMPICSISTAANLFDHINKALADKGVPWSNVVDGETQFCFVKSEA